MPRLERTKILNYLRLSKDGDLPPPGRLDQALDGLIEIVGAERGLIAIPECGSLRVVSARGLGKKPLADDDKKVSRTLYGHAIGQKQVCLISPVLGNPLFAEAESLNTTARSAIAAPLMVGSKTYGVVMLLEATREKLFDGPEREDVDLFADIPAKVLARLVDSGAFAPPVAKPASHRFTTLVGESKAMLELVALLEQFRLSPSPVLIEGERGTGKELVARALHEHGPDPDGPFVAVNVANLQSTLFDAELFGAKKGAYTGASEARLGLVEKAAGGTLFLDEFGEMPRDNQAKLLRLLQQRTYRLVGGTSEKKLEARIVAATNQDLKTLVRKGSFRADLYDRFTLKVETAPLKKRRGDIPLLVAALLPRIAAEELRPVPALGADTLAELEHRTFPGNVRDLENVLRQLVLFGSSAMPKRMPGRRTRKNMVEISREEIAKAISEAQGNKREAAKDLGVSRSTLYEKMKQKKPS